MQLSYFHPPLRPLLASGAVLFATGSLVTAHTPAETAPSDEVLLEELHIISSPFKQTTDEFHQSATILAGDALRRRTEPSLGETLDGVPGVASTYFGPGSSRPVIRGLGGERIRVLTDGLGAIDVSGNSPDHAVSLEPALSQRVEVLRGPSTLLYGSSAVGGVVNVIDERVPVVCTMPPISGAAEVRYDTVSEGRTGLLALRGADGAFAWQASGLHRRTRDFDIPGLAEHHDEDHDEEEHDEHEEPVRGTLTNSAIRTTAGSLGGSWHWDHGYAGLAWSAFDTRYGVPGHEHGHHDEDEEHDEADHDAEEGHGDEGVRVDLRQRRWDARAEITEAFGPFTGARFSAGRADYAHRELEGDEVGTRFDHTGLEARAELMHRPVGPLEGAIGIHISNTRLRAEGEEAFLPSTRTRTGAVFLLEEAQAGPVRWQFGARLETQDIAVRDGSGVSRDKDALSLSTSAVWSLSEAWTLAASLARTERLPTAQELFADGPHIATATYEIGDPDLGKETSTGLDLALRRRTGRVTGSIGVFVNDIDRYIFQQPTGEEEDGLPVQRTIAREARLHGAEAELVWHVHETRAHTFDIVASIDTVRGTNRTERTDLPRLPPVRASLGLAWSSGGWSAGLDVRHAFEQNRTAPDEDPSDGYTLLGAHVGWSLPLERGSLHLFLRGSNLTDEEARPHTSFLRHVAPLPGRNITAGARWVF